MHAQITYKIIGESFGPIEALTDGKMRFNLNIDKSSWVDAFFLDKLPTNEEFEAIWNLHPEEKGTIKIFGNTIKTSRWYKAYDRSYYFSGIDHEADPIPDIVKPYVEIANNSVYAELYDEISEFNGLLLNWYENGSNYISPHADSENKLKKTNKGETLVYSISLQEGDINRIFRVKPMAGGSDRLDIETSNGLVLVMGGTCQKTHKHQVPKTTKKVGRRINITCRDFS